MNKCLRGIVSLNNIGKDNFKKIFSICIVILLVATVASTAIAQAKIGNGKEALKEKLNNLKEKIQDLKTKEKSKNSNDKTSKPTRTTLASTLNALIELKSSGSSINFYTNFNSIEKTTQLKIFGTTEVDVDDDGDKDISAKLILAPGIVRPFALSINFGLKIKRLNGFSNVNAFFEAYGELTRPGIIKKDATGDKVRFGYQSPYGDRVPESCTVTYKYVPHLFSILKKPEHRAQVDPSSDVVGKENLIIVLGYIDVSDGLTDEFRVAYSPAAKTEVTLGRQVGKTIEFTRERAGDSKVDLYLTHIKNGNTTYVYSYDLPSQVSFILDFGRDGIVEFDTHGEKASEIGICDDFDDPSMKLFFKDLPTKAGIEWHRRLIQGTIEVKVYREGTDGVYFNAYLEGPKGNKFYGQCRVKADRDSPITMTFGERGDGEAEISLGGKSLEITDVELNYYKVGNGTYSIGCDQFIRDKEGSVDIYFSIKKQEGSQTTLDVTIDVIGGVEIHGVKVGFNGSWVPAPPPFDDIITDGDHTYQFTVIIEGFTIKIGDGWGYILFQGSISLSSYHDFEYNGTPGAVKGIISIGSGGILNISWATIDGQKVFNIKGLRLSLTDFVFWFGDKVYLSIPSLVGNIELIDASNTSGQFIFTLAGMGTSGNFDFDFYFNFDDFPEVPDFKIDTSIDDFSLSTADTTAKIEFAWDEEGASKFIVEANTNIEITIEDLDWYSFKQGNEPKNDSIWIFSNMTVDAVGNVGVALDFLQFPLLEATLKDTTFYLYADDIRNVNSLGNGLISGETLLDLDVDGEASIIFHPTTEDIEGYIDGKETTFLRWKNTTIGIDATKGLFTIKKFFSEYLIGTNLDINYLIIDGNTELIISQGLLTYIINEGTDEEERIWNLLYAGLYVTDDPGTLISCDTVYVNITVGLINITEEIQFDTSAIIKVYDLALDDGRIDVFVKFPFIDEQFPFKMTGSLELSEGSAINYVGVDIVGIIDDEEGLYLDFILEDPINYAYVEFSQGENEIDPPYNQYLLIDTNNQTITWDMYLKLNKDFLNQVIDIVSEFIGASIPHVQHDQGIRCNDITLKADMFYVYLNASVSELFDGYLQVINEGDLLYLKDGEWVPLFGDFKFKITVTPGHIKIEILDDIDHELIDFYNEDLDLTLYGYISADAGMIIDIYFNLPDGDAKIQVNGDVTIEDLIFKLGTSLVLTADELYLDIDAPASITFNIEDFTSSIIELDANIDTLFADSLYLSAHGNSLSLSGTIDCSAAAKIHLKTDLQFSFLEFYLEASGSITALGFNVNINSGAIVISGSSLGLTGRGSVTLGEDIVADATISSLSLNSVHISGSGGGIMVSCNIDASLAAIIYIKSDLAFSNVIVQISGGGTLTITGLNLNINSGQIVVTCISLTIVGSGYLSIGSSFTASATLTRVDINTLSVHGSDIQLGQLVLSCDLVLSASGVKISINIPVTYFELDVTGSGTLTGDITLKVVNIAEVTIQNLEATAGKLKFAFSSTNKYVEIDSDVTATWGWGEIKIIPIGLTFGYDGLGGDLTLKGDLRIDWTGTLPSNVETLKIVSNEGFELFANALIVEVNDVEILRVGIGGIISGDIEADVSNEKEITLTSTNGFNININLLQITIEDKTLSLGIGAGIISGDITFKWGYMPSEAKCVEITSTSGFDSKIPSITLNSQIIVEIDIDMNPGTSFEFRDWYTAHDGLSSSYDVFFDGTITVTLCRITISGETTEFSGTLTGNNAHLAIAKSGDITYIIRDSSGTSTASGLTFSSSDGDITGSLTWIGDLKSSFDKTWGESGNGKKLEMISQNGYDGNVDINVGNFHVWGSRDLDPGNALFAFDIPIGQDVTKKIEMDTNPTSFINSFEFGFVYGNLPGIRIGPSTFWAEDFHVYWNFMSIPWEWDYDGSIGGGSIPLIEATEDGGSTWEQIWPIIDDNEPPVCDILQDDYYSDTETAIFFDSTASDPEGEPIQYFFDWGDGEPGVGWIDVPANGIIDDFNYHRYKQGGDFTVTLTVREKAHPLKQGTDTANVHITNNHPPEVYIHIYGPYGLWLSRTAKNGGGSYLDGETDVQYKFSAYGNLLHPQHTEAYFGIKCYRWYEGSWEDWTYGDTVSDRYYSWNTPGIYYVKLDVMDNNNVSRMAEMMVEISTAIYPVADAGGLYSGFVGDLIDLDGSESQPDGKLEYRWDWTNNGFYDTSWSDSSDASHEYQEGSHTVKIQVRRSNNRLLRDTDTSTVTITAAEGYIQGHVYDASNGNPISNAIVETDPGYYSDYTDSSGFYSLTVDPDTYIVAASHSEYSTEISNSITVANGETKTKNFYLDPVAKLNGYVKDTNNNGIGNAKVELDTGQYVYTLPSGVNIGYYTFNEIDPGVYDVTASKSGYISKTVYNHPVSQGANILHFTLQPALPSVSTVQISDSDVGSTSAELPGYLNDLGDASSCKVWFVYDTSYHSNWQSYAYSTESSSQTMYSTGSFSKTVTGLQATTTYHYRAVAQNSNGYDAGSDKSFTTKTCFLAGTKISMADNTQKNIEDVKIGEMVKTFDEENQKVTIGKVLNVLHHTSDIQMAKSYLVINNKLKVTGNHPIYVNEKWTEAGEIQIGDKLQNIDGSIITVKSIKKIFEQVPTYNLEIETYHTYYAENILVHNKPQPGWVRPSGYQGTTGWQNENNARDSSTSTYSHYYRVGDYGTTDYALILTYSSPVACNQMRIDAENMNQLIYMSVKLYEGSTLKETCFFTSWNDHSYTSDSFSTKEIDTVKITFTLDSGFGYGVYNPRVYDFQVYRV